MSNTYTDTLTLTRPEKMLGVSNNEGGHGTGASDGVAINAKIKAVKIAFLNAQRQAQHELNTRGYGPHYVHLFTLKTEIKAKLDRLCAVRAALA